MDPFSWRSTVLDGLGRNLVADAPDIDTDRGRVAGIFTVVVAVVLVLGRGPRRAT